MLEQPFEIVRVRRQDDRRRSIANGCRGHQRVDPVVALSETAQPPGPTSRRLVGRLKHACGALEHAENAIDLCFAVGQAADVLRCEDHAVDRLRPLFFDA